MIFLKFCLGSFKKLFNLVFGSSTGQDLQEKPLPRIHICIIFMCVCVCVCLCCKGIKGLYIYTLKICSVCHSLDVILYVILPRCYQYIYVPSFTTSTILLWII